MGNKLYCVSISKTLRYYMFYVKYIVFMLNLLERNRVVQMIDVEYKTIKDKKYNKIMFNITDIKFASSSICMLEKYEVPVEHQPGIFTSIDHETFDCQDIVQYGYDVVSPKTRYFRLNLTYKNELLGNKQKTYILGFPIELLSAIRFSIQFTEETVHATIKYCPRTQCLHSYGATIKDAHMDITGKACDIIGVALGTDHIPFVPTHIISCKRFPNFYIDLTNVYPHTFRESHKPQYNVLSVYSNNIHKYHIQFTNMFSADICYFGIRKYIGPSDTMENPYISDCGSQGNKKQCFVPCRDIQLKLEKHPVVDVIIKTRHHLLNDDSSGYRATKYVHSDAIINTGIISEITPNSAKINLGLYKNDLKTCKVFHYDVESLYTHQKIQQIINSYSPSNGTCQEFDIIPDLTPGTSYMAVLMVEIEQYLPFLEMLYFKTKGIFDITPYSFHVNDNNVATMSVVAKNEGDSIHCVYYVSLMDSNLFYEAECVDGVHGCARICSKNASISGIIPTAEYDIKVIAEPYFNEKILRFDGSLQLAIRSVEGGVAIDGYFPYETSENVDCNYNIYANDKNQYKLIYKCPAEGLPIKTTGKNYNYANSNERNTKSCPIVPKCSGFDFIENFDPNTEYLICVKPQLDIVKNKCYEIPKDLAENTDNWIDLDVRYSLGKVFTTVKPHEKINNADAKCGWNLRTIYPDRSELVQQCNVVNQKDCIEISMPCKQFTIHNIKNAPYYRLTVYFIDDKTIRGIKTFNINEFQLDIAHGNTYVNVTANVHNQIDEKDSICHWKLLNLKYEPPKIEKECSDKRKADCVEEKILCKRFSIVDIKDWVKHKLVVHYSKDKNIYGKSTIYHGNLMVRVERDTNKMMVIAIPFKDDTKDIRKKFCSWKLRNLDENPQRIEKQCQNNVENNCPEEMTSCENFTIYGVQDNSRYELIVNYRDYQHIKDVPKLATKKSIIIGVVFGILMIIGLVCAFLWFQNRISKTYFIS